MKEMEEKNEKKDFSLTITRSLYQELNRRSSDYIKLKYEYSKLKRNLTLSNTVGVVLSVALAFMTLSIYAEKEHTTKLEKSLEALKAENVKLKTTVEEYREHAYPLTDEERALVESTVMGEAENQGYIGQLLIAQCIRNGCEIDDLSPEKVIEVFGYADGKKPSLSVKQAVSDVFDKGVKYTDEPILYFYAPDIVESAFHESQNYALMYKDHKFFSRKA